MPAPPCPAQLTLDALPHSACPNYHLSPCLMALAFAMCLSRALLHLCCFSLEKSRVLANPPPISFCIPTVCIAIPSFRLFESLAYLHVSLRWRLSPRQFLNGHRLSSSFHDVFIQLFCDDEFDLLCSRVFYRVTLFPKVSCWLERPFFPLFEGVSFCVL